MCFKCKGPLPIEHPEYSLGLAFSLLLCEIFLIPEVGLHLFKIHATDSCEGVLGDGRGCVGSCLFGRGSVNLCDILGAGALMAASVELALAALILRLLAVLYSMSILAAVEALVASWCRGLRLSLLLIVPGEGANIFFSPGSWSKFYSFDLMDRLAGARFFPSSGVHVVHLQIVANFFYGDEGHIIVGRALSRREELVSDSRMNVVLEESDSCVVVGLGIILQFHELHDESNC